MKELDIAIIQMQVIDDKKVNIKKAEEMITRTVEQRSKNAGRYLLVVLPEMFNCPYQNELFSDYAEEEGGYTFQELSRIAEQNNIYLVGGSVPEIEKGRIYNTSYIFNNSGEKIGKHRKIHLFDIDIEGGQTFQESATLSAGNKISLIDTPFIKMGVMICYDIRFPELSRMFVDKGVELLVVPGAFNMTTGPAHWEILFRTRALDNQVYILGAAPARDEEGSYISYGNSIVVNPWGKVINRLGKEEGILITTINLDYIKKVRGELPLLKHRRLDLYNLQEI